MNKINNFEFGKDYGKCFYIIYKDIYWLELYLFLPIINFKLKSCNIHLIESIGYTLEDNYKSIWFRILGFGFKIQLTKQDIYTDKD